MLEPTREVILGPRGECPSRTSGSTASRRGRVPGRDGPREERTWDCMAAVADRRVTFADGVLELRCAYARSPGGRFTDGELRRGLEAGL